MQITAQTLIEHQACASQVDLFRQRFGEKPAPLSERVALEVAHLFDWDWAVQNLLTPPQQKAYHEAIAPARKVYNKAVVTAHKAYDEALDEAMIHVWKVWKAYDEAAAGGSARKAYNEAIASAWKARNDVMAPVWKAYDEAQAVAFVTACKLPS